VAPDDRAAATRWLSANVTLSDLQATLSSLQTTIDSKSLSKSSKPRQWLASCAERVAFYGTIMNVMVQHHPEYVALAWGAFKFLFTVGPTAPTPSLDLLIFNNWVLLGGRPF
jgi:hypothetical protein